MSEGAADNQETAAGFENKEAQALLEAANKSSERLAGLHLAFMAVCAYVLTIVFSTTDFDLLVGKGIKLPVVGVDVPIVGFYVCAPFIVVLVHFNLLLQLQLLSRKLFAFEAAAPPEEGLGGLRDRLHIFPYTYYLVGRPSPLVRPLIGLMVSITLVLLPLLTLLALQLWFLAYQSQTVTWWQRGAIWLDTAMIAVLWPLILHPGDDWRGYWRELLAAQVPRPRAWLALALLLVGYLLFLFGVWWPIPVLGLGLLLVSARAVIRLRCLQATPRFLKVSVAGLVIAAILAVALGGVLSSSILFLLGPLLLLPLAVLWQPRAPRGSLALLLTLLLGLLLPLALQVDGGGLERLVAFLQPRPAQLPAATLFSKKLLQDNRRLDLNEQVLLAKPPTPQTLALIRSGHWQAGLQQIGPLNLKSRSLRHANMVRVILVRADLQKAQLQGADLREAQLQGANLWRARLQGADLWGAQLQGANLQEAQLQATELWEIQLQVADLRFARLQAVRFLRAQLQGADLRFARLQGAELIGSQLQGANLQEAQLQGANLQEAQLQGADLGKAELQGAYLGKAQLQGADFHGANIYAAEGRLPGSGLIDARKVVWAPLEDKKLVELINDFKKLIKDKRRLKVILILLKRASGSTPSFHKMDVQSCLARSNTPLVCDNPNRYDPQKPEELAAFKKQLHTYLAKLACTSPWIAQGLIEQIEVAGPDSSRRGLEKVLKECLGCKNCPGLQGLSQKWKDRLKAIK